MFTGIIEDIGVIERIGPSSLRLKTKLNDVQKGDSIAVNGTCLTVTEILEARIGRIIGFEYSPETRRKTNIALLNTGSLVNLERALRAGDRIGGHFVTGHIEDTGVLLGTVIQENSRIFRFGFNTRLRRYIVPKGSIAVDGISLTVAERSENSFTVAVIPHTLEHTNLGSRRSGEVVNLETDILAKYAEQLLTGREQQSNINREFLKEYGFIG